MDIEGIRHKALNRFFLTGSAKGLDGNIAPRLLKMLTYILNAGTFDDLKMPPNYGLHPLTGNRSGEWSMTVTKNWRLTFRKIDEQSITDLDLEDYH